MEFKIISDTHNDHRLLRPEDLECDVLVHCGDWGTKGNHTESENFLWWFVRQPAKYKIFVPGNHDGRYKKGDDLKKLAADLGLYDATNTLIEIENIQIWGCDFVPYFSKADDGWNVDGGHVTEQIPFGLDLLITHAPPLCILDENKDGVHCGSNHILEAIRDKKPRYHVFGHIHEQRARSMDIFETTCYNCAVKDRNYNLACRPTTIII